jgi:hypothetical protein
MKTRPAKTPLLLLAGAVVLCLAGCATNSKRAPTHTHSVALGKPTVFYEEGHVDTEPCCELWGERMPKLFAPGNQGSSRPSISLER